MPEAVEPPKDSPSRTPRGLTPDVRSDWSLLARPDEPTSTFGPDALNDLPDPVRRWLRQCIAPGTPLHRSVELQMSGRILLGAWRPFSATQRLDLDRGFVWAATARFLGLPVVGFDRYTRGSGQMSWRLFGAIPVMRSDGADVTRSAAGRHAGEVLVAAPAAALNPAVTWRADDDEHATAAIPVGDGTHEVTVTVDSEGLLTELVMRRWGNPDGQGFAEHVFGGAFADHGTFDGFTIPRSVVAGWHYGTERWAEGEFIRYEVEKATYR